MNEKFESFRQQYKEFIYKDYHIDVQDDSVTLTFDFEVPGLCEFHPSNKIRTTNLKVLNNPTSEIAKRIAFSLGMVELISYWKPMCPPVTKVLCGELSEEDVLWWKQLYFGGLGEFFYTNNIETSFEEFMTIECDSPKAVAYENVNESQEWQSAGLKIIPVGGGKDSNVTMELTKSMAEKVFCFTVNDQPAREESAKCAGYSDDKIIRTYRTLDQNMLKLNKEGFLNGHTPFSAIVAFLSAYCAYLIGADHIVLSNESSANESNIEGMSVNHQYSKSYEFEHNFYNYFADYVGVPIKYFSLLRAFNELQIAKQFCKTDKYLKVFRSCNAGSKKNVWCCNCAKCLFVYIIISPFLSSSKMVEIFGENLFERADLKDIFDGLVGFSPVKPFECVGTHIEINAALLKTVENYLENGEKLPFLLEYYYEKVPHENGDYKALLTDYCAENDIPEEFLPFVKEMYEYVSIC